MKNIDMITEYIVDEDDYIASPCYNCPYDNPRVCDCSVCEVDDEEFEDEDEELEFEDDF